MKTNKAIQLTVMSLVTVASLTGAHAGNDAVNPSPNPIQETTSGDWMSDFGLGAQIGTNGVGIHFDYVLQESLYFRLEGNYFDHSDDFEVDGIDLDGKLQFSNIGLTANYRPISESGFKVVAGAFFGRNRLRGTADGVGETIEVNDQDYVLGPNDSLTGSFEFNTVNPYLGLGWDWELGAERNYIIGLELGVRFMGSPDVGLSGTGVFLNNPDVEAERQEFENEAEDYQFYPVIRLSFTYRF